MTKNEAKEMEKYIQSLLKDGYQVIPLTYAMADYHMKYGRNKLAADVRRNIQKEEGRLVKIGYMQVGKFHIDGSPNYIYARKK
jgi:CRISPR/Cas system-associated protein endoribonuclease Cas2